MFGFGFRSQADDHHWHSRCGTADRIRRVLGSGEPESQREMSGARDRTIEAVVGEEYEESSESWIQYGFVVRVAVCVEV